MESILTWHNTVTSRFIEVYNHLRKTNQIEGTADFSKRTGITINTIKKVMDGELEIGDMELSAIGVAFPQLGMDWLRDGKGQMIHPDPEPKTDVKQRGKPGPKPGPKSANTTPKKEPKVTKPEAFRDPVSERYYRFIEYSIAKGRVKNATRFGRKIGTSGAVFTAIKIGTMSITTERIERTGREFPELNMNWLFTGNGNMINGDDAEASTTVPADSSSLQNLSGTILGKLKDCRLLLDGSWESAASGTGMPLEDFDLLEAGQKPYIPQALMQYLHEAGIDMNSFYDNNSQSVWFRKEQEGNYEEILKRLNTAENSVLDMQQSGRENLTELQQLRKILTKKSQA